VEFKKTLEFENRELRKISGPKTERERERERGRK
jgi:hypothetical protein